VPDLEDVLAGLNDAQREACLALYGPVGNVPAQDLAIAMIITNPGDYSPVLVPALELMVAEAS
jgi:hypothetical protein